MKLPTLAACLLLAGCEAGVKTEPTTIPDSWAEADDVSGLATVQGMTNIRITGPVILEEEEPAAIDRDIPIDRTAGTNVYRIAGSSGMPLLTINSNTVTHGINVVRTHFYQGKNKVVVIYTLEETK